MIDQQTIDRIIDAAQIEQVVSDYVTLRKRGVNLIGLCPFHNEKTPSFTVSPSKGICKCFGCGKGGNSVNFIMEVEQLSYHEALKHLAKKYNIEVVKEALTKISSVNFNWDSASTKGMPSHKTPLSKDSIRIIW
jgi:DNA primase